MDKKNLAKPYDLNLAKAHELKNEVNSWINREFNFIRLEVFETMAEKEDTHLSEFIEELYISTDDVDEWFNFILSYYEKVELIEKYKAITGVNLDENMDYDWLIDNYKDEIKSELFPEGQNYPVWMVIFEFKSEPPPSWVEHVKEVGLGVISGLEHFNTALFAMSAGHSFYSTYWIPLYLKCIDTRGKWEDVKYDMM